MNGGHSQQLPQQLQTLTQRVIGCAIAVHRELGPGHLEGVYQKALAIEFSHEGLGFVREASFDLTYRDHAVGSGRLDFLIERTLILELKAVEALAPAHQAQVIAYLKAIRLPAALLINFNEALLKNGVKRLVNPIDPP